VQSAPDRLARRRVCGAALALAVSLGTAAAAFADGQTDPELAAVVRTAIAATSCEHPTDKFATEVFFKLQEPRLRHFVPDSDERLDILRHVWCETNRVVRRYETDLHVALKLPPELVLAVMEVESRFNRYAVSRAGAVGLMQVMPFWPQRLGVENRLFGSIDFNIRLGCEILAYYMHAERNDYRRALARYNGSYGRREYPDLVLSRLAGRWRG
jgi:soluble lytic murein transglycosylase-like protein